MTEIEGAPPRLWEHVCTVFGAMQKVAKSEKVAGKHALVWTGHTTHLFRELGLATPYYSSVLQRLQQMGCLKQLSRGGGSAPSRWELLDDPNFVDFENASQPKTEKPWKTHIEDRLSRVEGILDLRETGT